MPPNGRWDLIRRLKFKVQVGAQEQFHTLTSRSHVD